MIKSRNAEVAAVPVKAVEGKPMYGGDMFVKPLINGDEMTFLEIHYAAEIAIAHLRCRNRHHHGPVGDEPGSLPVPKEKVRLRPL